MKKANVFRIGFGLLYIIGGIINLIITIVNVEIFRSWKDSAILSIYSWFIENVPTYLLIGTIVCVVIYQITIGLMILNKHIYVKLGLLGAIAFHIAIIPWGLWNLPNLIFIIPLYILMKYDFDKTFIEQFNKRGIRDV